ncbi:MAG TPA: sigma-70 family RNA polymerase sigma factor [Caulobacteraceae bacterium]
MSAPGAEDTERPAAAQILAIAQRGDRSAFTLLFVRFAPKVKAFLIRRGARAPEELTQEVMLSVWRKAAYFDPVRGTGEAWIFAIARNALIDSIRRQRGHPLVEMDPAANAPEPVRGDVELEAAEEARRVRAAVTALSPEQIEVVKLSFFDDRPHPEIAARLGLPLGTVKSRLRLAMRRLRTLLDDVR